MLVTASNHFGDIKIRLSGRIFLCTENPQLGWGFRKAFSFEPVIKTPFDLLKHLAVWQLQVSNK
ncbi:hypothetical protein ACVWBY_23825, partial [Escherichia coli]